MHRFVRDYKYISSDKFLNKYEMEKISKRKYDSIERIIWSCFVDKFSDYKKEFYKTKDCDREAFIVDKYLQYEQNALELRETPRRFYANRER